MNLYSYRYETTIGFLSDASAHAWLLRCIPRREQFQRIIRADFSISAFDKNGYPVSVTWMKSTDGFGTPVVFGEIPSPHRRINVVSSGVIALQTYRICDAYHGMYRVQTNATAASSEMASFAKEAAGTRFCSGAPENTVLQTAFRIGNAVHDYMAYLPGSTSVMTTAADAFASGCGVCQDYAHITIGILRSYGIPARYACGFLNGEGATHAWVEFFANGVWLPLDPTNGQNRCRGYIKIAHGRDSTDCAVNRGVFTGGTGQQLTVSTKVFEVSAESASGPDPLALRHSSPACTGSLSKDHQ